jgi:division protein CdvB (Snf7/Vps24/ESCRT-III family)
LSRIADAYTKRETACACVFANELSEVRKVSLLIINSKLALEQIAFRLQTVSEKNDVLSTLGVALVVMQTVKSRFVSIFPEAESEFGGIGNMLVGIITEASQSEGMSLKLDVAKIDLDKILSQTAAVARQRIKEKFPDSCKSY